MTLLYILHMAPAVRVARIMSKETTDTFTTRKQPIMTLRPGLTKRTIYKEVLTVLDTATRVFPFECIDEYKRLRQH